ncbi:MAG: metallophosphoesterase [Paludibacter sp.]
MPTIKLSAIYILLFILIGWPTILLAQQNEREPGKRKHKDQDKNNEQRMHPVFMTDIHKLIGNVIVGSPTDNSVTISFLAENGMNVWVEYGSTTKNLTEKTKVLKADSDSPIEFEISNLNNNSRYFYCIKYKKPEDSQPKTTAVFSFQTHRSESSSFTFGVQGDSHPERQGKMFSPDLYHITAQNVAASKPDFYFMMGDDFSIDHLIEKNEISTEKVDGIYLNQRQYVGEIACSSPLFLVNGNHEQAAKYLLDGNAENPAVLASNSRKKFYPLPSPSDFYSGDSEKVDHVGFLKDYYAFDWGDALFVVIDPYWHSDKAVDNVAGKKMKKQNEPWAMTLGLQQYNWFKTILDKSKARYKFVFCHHVLGSGRGGIENAKLYEWGGYNRHGEWEFDKMRPSFEMPIQPLMAKNHVSIFFQGHDHLFVRQELDGVIYQSVPNPADNTYTAFNADAYQSGDVLPNSGFLKVNVSAKEVKVEYIRSFLKADEKEMKNGDVAFSYTLK